MMTRRWTDNEQESDDNTCNFRGISGSQCGHRNTVQQETGEGGFALFGEKILYRRQEHEWAFARDDYYGDLYFGQLVRVGTGCGRHDLRLRAGVDCGGSGAGDFPRSRRTRQQARDGVEKNRLCYGCRLPQGEVQKRRARNHHKPSYGGVFRCADDQPVHRRRDADCVDYGA